MYQAVLVHTEVDEGAELGHVADGAFEQHAHRQVLDVLDAIGQLRHLEIGSRVAAGFLQFGQHILDSDGAEALVGERLGLQCAQDIAAPQQLAECFAGGGDQLLDQGVGLGVHARKVERVVAARDAQEARRLLEGLGAEAGHLEQLLAVAEGAVRIAPTHDVRRHRGRQARHARQQRRRCGVQIHTDGVDAILDHRIEAARQAALIHIVLVLADADALGIDLHQFREWVLHAPCNAHGAAQADVEIRQFLAGHLAGRIDRSTGFTGDQFLDHRARRALSQQGDHLGGELVGFAAGRAVADGDQAHAVRGGELGQCVKAALPIAPRLVRIDRGGLEYAPGFADQRHLHPRADAGVQAHHDALAGRRGEQEIAQVVAEDLDRRGLGRFAQAREQIALKAQREFDFPGPGHALANQVVTRARLVAPTELARDARLGRADFSSRCFRSG